MGDLNADCSYVPKSNWSYIALRSDSRFFWLIGDDVDTTVASTHVSGICLFYFILFYFILFYFILFYFILFYFILFYLLFFCN